MEITLKKASTLLQNALQAHTGQPGQDALWLLEYILGAPYQQLVTQKNIVLTQEQTALLSSVIADIHAHKPIAYIIGWVPFLKLIITIHSPILIPRPETEYWCNELIEKLSTVPNIQKLPLIIADMCAGSGCIGLSLAQSLPNAQVYVVDINPEACKLATQNAVLNSIKNITIVESDLFSKLPSIKFDLIVSNPPYIAPEEFNSLDNSVKLWEDKRALIAEDSGLQLIEKIIQHAKVALNKNAALTDARIPQLWLEIGHQQGKLVKQMMEQASFCRVEVMQDLSKKDRVVKAEHR